MFKKALVGLLILCCFAFVGCNSSDNSQIDNDVQQESSFDNVDNHTTSDDSSSPNADDSGNITEFSPEFNAKTRLQNFWEDGVMYNECITFIQQANGEIRANTLFTPLKIYSITDYTMKTQYVLGEDYYWNEGSSNIVRTENSPINYFYRHALVGKKSEKSNQYLTNEGITNIDNLGRCMLCEVVLCTGEWVYGKQYLTTYQYDIKEVADKNIVYTDCQSDKLSNTSAKLENNENLNVLFYGDSIFYGGDASALHQREPYQPLLHEQVKEGLEFYTGGQINLVNASVGGWGSYDGATALTDSYLDSIAPDESGFDLAIIGFGMNDIYTDSYVYKSNVATIVDTILSKYPGCEIILVSPMSPNPKSTCLGNQIYQFDRLNEIASTKTNVALVDVFSVHKKILEYKPFISTSGNNLNHPNDWLIRIYAQNILSAIVDR